MDELEVEVAKPGRFVGVGGRRVELSEDDLEQIAAAFDPARSTPVKNGHGTAAETVGQVLRLAFDSAKRRLMAKIRPLPRLLDLIRRGHGSRSMELRPENGRLSFLALAFLPPHVSPAISGLAPIELAAGIPAGVICLRADDPDLSRFDLSEADRRRAEPRSLQVHDLVIEELRRAASEGERLDYSAALDRVARDPENREAVARWMGY